MPIKHQSESYRKRSGRKFICWSDVATKDEARAVVCQFRRDGKRSFYEMQDGGAYGRVYVESPNE